MVVCLVALMVAPLVARWEQKLAVPRVALRAESSVAQMVVR